MIMATQLLDALQGRLNRLLVLGNSESDEGREGGVSCGQPSV